MKKVSYDKSQEPLVISKPVMDILLKQKKYSDLISLYLFYYYTAKWQRTDQARATTAYTANGMNWTEERVRKIKKILIYLGLIEDISQRDDITQIILGHYVRVHFKWDSHTTDYPHCEKYHSVDNPTPNALYKNNINALETNNKNALDSENNKLFSSSIFVAPKNGATVSDKKNEIYYPIIEKLGNIITSKKRINIDGRKKSSWANSVRQLCENDGVEPARIETALDWYERHHMDDYVPVIESGKSLREKFLKLEAAIERSKTQRRSRTVQSGYSDLEPLTYKKPKIV